MKFRLLSSALLIALAIWQTPLSSSAASKLAPIAAATPCGVTRVAPAYDHVVWILLENAGYSVVNSPSAPYLNSLGHGCGLAVNDLAVSHPSLPNYIALTSGSTQGVTDDNEPSAHPLTGPSIFSELGGNWRALVQSMPNACDHDTSGSYAARHNPAVYYVSLAAACQRNDAPLTLPLNLNARFTFITPNLCNDMHSCPVASGDRWLAQIVPTIIKSEQYQSRSMVLFITFDENEGGSTNRVPTYVVAPSVPRGERVSVALTHYSLLRTTETLLHLPLLGAAQNATSMVAPFHL
ncbi:MAG: alkaline phosphatase family protein [Acidimicrobiales bacterium]